MSPSRPRAQSRIRLQPQPEPADSSLVKLLRHPFNPFFTGRAKVLNDLREALQESHLVVLNGAARHPDASGIGKTEAATAYTHRYRADYHQVLWLRADDPCTLIEDSLAALATVGVEFAPERPWDQSLAAVRTWLESNQHWLLILDNVDHSDLIKSILPERPSGHVLAVSSRQASSVLGVVRSVTLSGLTQEEAVRFLFKRTHRVDNDPVERRAATDLAALLGGVPAALELAGAFVAALDLPFREHLGTLRGRLAPARETKANHDQQGDAVGLTALLSWEEILQASPESAECLRASALLGRELLSLDLLRQWGEDAGPVLAPALDGNQSQHGIMQECLGLLARVGLIHRTPDPAGYAVHPAVQRMAVRQIEKRDAARWAERLQRVVERVCLTNGQSGSIEAGRVLPWLAVAANLARDGWLKHAAGAEFFERLTTRFQPLAGFPVTEPLYLGALGGHDAAEGDTHARVADLANEVAQHYLAANKRAQADQYFTRALTAREHASGPMHPDIAQYLHDLGRRYDEQGRHLQADEFLRRSLAIREHNAGKRHPEIATYHHVLGCRYLDLSRREEADQCFAKALAIKEEAYGPNDQNVADYLHELACRLSAQGRYEEAEPLFERALLVARTELPPGHAALGVYSHSMGRLCHQTGRLRQAEKLYRDALANADQMPKPDAAAAYNDLGSLYHQRRRYAKAEPLLKQALALARQSFPDDHLNLAICLNNLAALHFARRRYAEAEPLYQQALAIRRKHLPPDHPDLLTTLENYLLLLRKQKRAEEADTVAARVGDIRARLGLAEGVA